MRQIGRDYYDQLPKDMIPVMGRSAIYSFTAILLFRTPRQTWNLQEPLIRAGIAALASCIHSLATPIFNYLFEDNRVLVHRELMKSLLVSSTITLLYASVATQKVNLTALPFLVMLPFNCFKSLFMLFPDMMDFVDPQFTNAIKRAFHFVGLEAPPGSASIYLVSDIIHA